MRPVMRNSGVVSFNVIFKYNKKRENLQLRKSFQFTMEPIPNDYITGATSEFPI